MNVYDIFEKVNLSVPINKRRFFNFLNDTVYELVALYGEKIIKEDKSITIDISKEEYPFISEDDTGNYTIYIANNGRAYVKEKTTGDIKELNDNLYLDSLFMPPIVDNILFLSGGGDEYKGEFLRKSNEVYLRLWNRNAKGKRIRRSRW